MVRAFFFDFDGTLADSFPAIAASVNHVRSLRGLLPLTEAEVRAHVGWGPGHLLGQTVPVGDPAENANAYREHHPGVMATGTRLLPGSVELLEAISTAGYPIVLTSNKPRLYSAELLAILGIAHHFTAVLGPEDVTHPKPAPDMLLAALECTVRLADQAIYIGDMTVDIATARGAGVPIWIVCTGAQSRDVLEAERPDALFDDLDAIHRRLIEMQRLPAR